MDKVGELVGGGCVINEATPSSLLRYPWCTTVNLVTTVYTATTVTTITMVTPNFIVTIDPTGTIVPTITINYQLM